MKDSAAKERVSTDTATKDALKIALKSLGIHLDASQHRKTAILIVLTFMSAIFDVFGLAAILPLVKLATTPSAIHTNQYMRYLFDTLGFSNDTSFLLFVILSVLAFYIMKSIFGIFVNYLQVKFSARLAYSITRKQFNKHFNLDFHRFTSMKSSVIINHILNNPLSYVTWVVLPIIMIISESFIVLLIVIGIAWYDLELLLFIAAIIGPATWLVYRLLQNRVTYIGAEMDRLYPLALGSLTQTITGYIDIKLSNREAFYRDVFLKSQRRYHNLNMASYLPNLIPLRANELIALLGIVLIFIYALLITHHSEEAIIMVSLFAAAAYRLMPSLNRIVTSLMSISKNMSAINNLAIFPELNFEMPPDNHVEPLPFQHTIEITNLSFRFPNSEQDVLKKLNMTVKKGEKIGIVGASGSGKTTLMNVILRFYEERSGSISIDGTRVTKENTDNWRALMGYVKQDIFLLDASIRDNITFGDIHPDEDRLKQAIRLSSLEQLVKELPEGENTIIGERGSRISGGQRQRISIARSLYRNASILIFDEATSALDNQTEQEVSEAIDSLSDADKTIFIIAHRITTLKNCDRIYELSDGEIKGVYSYQELLEKVL